jgi:hypothetical protein
MTPEQSQALVAELRAASAEALRAAEGLSRDQLTRRPPAGGWSVAECLQHLILTSEAMRALLEPAIARAESRGRAAEKGRLGFTGFLLVRMLEPPARFRTKTAPAFVPGAVDSPDTLGVKLVAENDRLEDLVERCAGLALNSERIESPFRAGVFYPPYAAFRIIATHLRRHLWQARQVRRALGV